MKNGNALVKLETPPLPLPLKGGAGVGSVSSNREKWVQQIGHPISKTRFCFLFFHSGMLFLGALRGFFFLCDEKKLDKVAGLSFFMLNFAG